MSSYHPSQILRGVIKVIPGGCMKNRLFSSLCFVILDAFLYGCGKEAADSEIQPTGNGQEENLGLPEGYVLYPCFEDAGGDVGMNDICMAGDSLYYYTNVYDPDEESFIRDVYVREKGQEARHLLQFGKEKVLLGMTADEEGCLYLLWGENETEEGFETCTLEKQSSQLEEIYSVDTTEGMDGLWVYDMAAASDGKLYGLTLSGKVLCWDENGAFQGRFTLPVSGSTALGVDRICYGLANAGAAGVYAFWGGMDQEAENSIHLYELNKLQNMGEAESEHAEPLRVDYASAEETVAIGDMYIFSGYSDGLYMADQNRMWRINVADGSLEAFFEWQDINLNYTSRCDNLTDRFVVLKDKFMQQICFEGVRSGSHYILRNDYDGNWEGYHELKPVTQEEIEMLRGMTEHIYFYENENLVQIISEEAGAFFAGDISAQEAADRIQNRANLLLGE